MFPGSIKADAGKLASITLTPKAARSCALGRLLRSWCRCVFPTPREPSGSLRAASGCRSGASRLLTRGLGGGHANAGCGDFTEDPAGRYGCRLVALLAGAVGLASALVRRAQPSSRPGMREQRKETVNETPHYCGYRSLVLAGSLVVLILPGTWFCGVPAGVRRRPAPGGRRRQGRRKPPPRSSSPIRAAPRRPRATPSRRRAARL